jgi:signal transduction histidine kinase
MRARWWIPIVVVLALAALQLRSVSKLHEADEQQLFGVAHEGVQGVAWDFNHELARAYDWFAADPSGLVGDTWDQFTFAYDAWQGKAPQPRLFRAWYLVTDDGGAGLLLRRYDAGSKRFTRVDWPAELATLRGQLAGENQRRLAGVVPRRSEDRVGPELGDPPAILVPLALAPDPWPAEPARPSYGYEVGLLDMDFVTTTFLPALILDNLGQADGLHYDVEISQRGTPVLRRGPRHPRYDVQTPLFRVGFAHLDDIFNDPDEDGVDRGIWWLRAVHRDGGIAAHVTHKRRSDYLLSAAVLALLLASVVLVVTSARRARRLAKQQLTFVAGITHELRTPLAVIRSAAENLADGLVGERTRVQKYGELLLGEGRRLSQMIEQAIDFAALEAGARAAPEQVYDLAELVEELVAARQHEVTARIRAPLPSLRGDPAATRLVLGNLVENARKHAPGAPIAIQVDAVDWLAGPAVRIEVVDRGGGIDPSDVPHLFEPFYRGKRARERQVPGSGLGLSVVKRLIEQQRGTIAVRSQLGQGSTFIVHLPGGQ